MTNNFGYSYYSNYNNAHSYYNNNAMQNKAQEASGGWSKGTAKGVDFLESGGWGKETKPAGVFTGTTFGTGSAFGANKSTFGKGTFSSGTSSFTAKSGFGTGYGGTTTFGKKQQRTPVPMKTVGYQFSSTKVDKYTVFHINVIRMFSQYTSDELRFYDYMYTDQIIPLQTAPQSQTQSKTSTFTTSAFQQSKKEEKVVNHPVHWWEVPNANWGDIKEPDQVYKTDSTFYTQPYLDLQPKKFEEAVSKTKEDELPINTRIKLKGFKNSDTTFSSHLDSFDLDQNTTSFDPSFQFDDFKIRYQFSMTPTQRGSSKSGKSRTNKSRSGMPKTSSDNTSSPKSETISSGLSIMPDITKLDQKEKLVSNLNISKDDIKLIFPFEVDCEKLDPGNNIHIDKETRIEKRPTDEKDKDGNIKYIDIKVVYITISIDVKKEMEQSVPSIIFYSIKVSEYDHFYIKTNSENIVERIGSIVNEYVPSLNCYPIEISYEEAKLQENKV